MITFYEAIDIYISKRCDENAELDVFDVVRDFIRMFEDGILTARGYSLRAGGYEEISSDFWRSVRHQFGIKGARFDFKWTGGDLTSSIWQKGNPENKIYESIEVYENVKGSRAAGNAQGAVQSKGGRKPTSSWHVISAIACRAIHEFGYPDNQMEFVRHIEAELDRLEVTGGVGRDSIIKLVRTICSYGP